MENEWNKNFIMLLHRITISYWKIGNRYTYIVASTKEQRMAHIYRTLAHTENVLTSLEISEFEVNIFLC